MALKFKILYVDDELDNLSVFKAAFKNDFVIQTFTSSKEAIEQIRKEHFQIIIADQRMPEMTGVELLESANEIDNDSVRILLTGYSDNQALADAINKGKVFYYSSKPWKRDELKLVLIKAIDHYVLVKRNKNLIKKLANTVHELETFLYRASHDLRAPITTQLGLLNLLKLEVSDSAKTYISKIEEMIDKLEHTLEKMSQLSIKGYDFVEDNLKFDLNPLVNDYIGSYRNSVDLDAIEIKTDLAALDNFYFEEEIAKVIVENIIENSLQYRRKSKEGSRILISNSYSPDGNEMTVVVEDNGIGIESIHLPNIYGPFYRGTALSKGNGLGLYIVKKICDTIDGRIEVTSDGSSWTKVSATIPNFRDKFKEK